MFWLTWKKLSGSYFRQAKTTFALSADSSIDAMLPDIAEEAVQLEASERLPEGVDLDTRAASFHRFAPRGLALVANAADCPARTHYSARHHHRCSRSGFATSLQFAVRPTGSWPAGANRRATGGSRSTGNGGMH